MFCAPDIELIVVKLDSSSPILLCCVYLPPKCADSAIITLISHLSSLSFCGPLLLIGDFNLLDIDWSSLTVDTPPSRLFVIPCSPTTWFSFFILPHILMVTSSTSLLLATLKSYPRLLLVMLLVVVFLITVWCPFLLLTLTLSHSASPHTSISIRMLMLMVLTPTSLLLLSPHCCSQILRQRGLL